MRWSSVVLLSSALFFVDGCKHDHPRFTVMLLDVSKSITPQSVADEFHMADSEVDKMQRGDRLTLTPITGNALSETPRRVLRLTAPVQRESYDHDMMVFRRQAHGEIRGMREAAISKPANRTDILGALDVAMQEFGAESNNNEQSKELIVLSDLLEDDGELNFTSDPRMVDSAHAQSLAATLRASRTSFGSTISTSVCSLRSTEFARLAKNRQKAIISFWKIYIGDNMPPTCASV